jgi:hypothetical protein
MSEEEAILTIDQIWVYAFIGIKEPLGLAPKKLMQL